MIHRWLLALLLVTPSAVTQAALQGLSDQELAGVTGQALFQANEIVGDGTKAGGSTGFNFFRVGLDATLDLNMNVGELELGRTGPGATEVDLWAENVAFGCVANSAGVCTDSASAGAGAYLRPFSLLRPYLEFAIENESSPTQRQVVGVRLGAENATGPLSFGMMKVFSGYLTATAQLTMEAMTDVAATCAAHESGAGTTTSGPYGGCPGFSDINYPDGLGNTGANIFSGTETCNDECNFQSGNYISMTANSNTIYSIEYLLSDAYDGSKGGTLGMANAEVCSVGLCAQFAATTVNIGTAQSGILNVAAAGKRLTQADVLQPGLGTLIDQAVSTLDLHTCNGNRWNDGSACTFGGWFPDLIRGPAGDNFKQQICDGLGYTTCNNTTLNNTALPFNLDNFHSVEMNTPLLGLSFQSKSLRYPGYALAQGAVTDPGYIPEAIMQAGWTLYLPDAFFLAVSEPTGVFTNNIASGAAGQGDLVGLDPVFDNCWGSATFC